MTRVFTLVALGLCCSFPLFAQEGTDSPDLQISGPSTAGPDAANGPGSTQDTGGSSQQTQTAPAHPAATTYSNGYELRLKIHKYSSWATLPLFATELALGQSLYDHPEGGAKKSAHGAVGVGIVGLFGLNTFTGAWNLWEGRHDTDGRTTRLIHSVLMLAADGGFLATTATGPHEHNGIITNPSDKSLHRDIAIASIGVATAGYLLMLLKGR